MYQTIRISDYEYIIDIYPNDCPFCHTKIIPTLVSGIKTEKDLQLLFRCSNRKCDNGFLGYYEQQFQSGTYLLINTMIGEINKTNFDKIIYDISPKFITIYNESSHAEQLKLFEICGVGYRKSIEFLIKDYLILNSPGDQDKILKNTLGECIKQEIGNINIKKVAERATWLGNDETHYQRKWEGKSLSDLKELILLTIDWIIMEERTKRILNDMP